MTNGALITKDLRFVGAENIYDNPHAVEEACEDLRARMGLPRDYVFFLDRDQWPNRGVMIQQVEHA